MRLLLDNIIFSLQKNGGISVVWYELLKYLNVHEKDIDLQYIEYDTSQDNFHRKNLIISPKSIYVTSSKFLFFKRYCSPVFRVNHKAIFHSSYYRIIQNKNIVNITTVHDFTYEYFSSGIKKWIHSWQKYRAIRQSDYIICVSENTKRDLLKFMPKVNEEKIRVIYNGVSEDYHPLENDELFGYSLPYKKQSYIIFVGGRKGYKNFTFAVKAIGTTGYKLVVVGSDLDKKESAILDKEMGRDNYINLTHIPNKLLNVLYNNAFCLIYPSSYEGFGIPIIEAQKAGCPTIAYNNSSIPEIILDSGLLINNLNVNEVHDHFRFIENKENRRYLVAKGFENAKRFSWNRMAKETVALYYEALEKSKL